MNKETPILNFGREVTSDALKELRITRDSAIDGDVVQESAWSPFFMRVV